MKGICNQIKELLGNLRTSIFKKASDVVIEETLETLSKYYSVLFRFYFNKKDYFEVKENIKIGWGSLF